MDELTFYDQSIQRIAEIMRFDLFSAAEYLQEELQKDPDGIQHLASIRKQFLTKDDANTGLYYFIKDNYFSLQTDDNVDALICMVIEISHASRIHYQLLAFEKYNPEQPIFRKYPELFQKIRKKANGNFDYELIRLDAVNFNPLPNMPKYKAFKYKDSVLYIDSYLDSTVPFYLMHKYGKEHLHIRLDPHYISKKMPQMPLEEEFLQPPNPHWIERLIIHSDQHEGTELFLPMHTEIGNEWEHLQWSEYSKGIRKLQIVATMKSEGNGKHFSMSFEELSEEAIEDGMLVGRMIHLDAIDSYDTPFEKVRLNHLDLAVNIYRGESIQERMNSTLASGKRITDASVRTHLIRADDIMFSDLLEIANMFFKSKTMIEEWINYQFKFRTEDTESNVK
ncbi:hypothetical protein J7E85_19635 [Paenibacillus sp. ISL-20]|nr:hypothetical protein [Paenibacillus sp. ISL-20]